MSDKDALIDDLQFADSDRLRHEIKFLRDRVTNLDIFKRLFFTLQEDLVEERSRYTELEAHLHSLGVPSVDGQEEELSSRALAPVTALKQELESSHGVEMLAITTANEHSALVDFFRNSEDASNYQEIVELLFASASAYRCEVSAELRCQDGELLFCQNDAIKDEHARVIKRLKLKGRLVEEKGMLCINHGKISLLASELPLDDIDRYGCIRDNLMVLASGANSVIDSLDAGVKLAHERKNLYKIVKGTHQAMEKVEKGIGDQIRKTSKVQNSFIQELASAVNELKQSPEDKARILDMLASGKKNLSKVLMETFVLDENFVDIISKLEKTYSVVESAEKNTQSEFFSEEKIGIIK